MNTKHITLSVCTLAGLMATVCFTTQPAIAQVRPALVKSVDEKGRNPYQVTLRCTSPSPNRPACTTSIDPIPAGKRLVLQFVSASIVGDHNPTNTPAGINIYPNDGTADILASFFPTPDSINYHFIVNSPLLLYVNPGKTISVALVYLSADFPSFITLTGYLVDIE